VSRPLKSSTHGQKRGPGGKKKTRDFPATKLAPPVLFNTERRFRPKDLDRFPVFSGVPDLWEFILVCASKELLFWKITCLCLHRTPGFFKKKGDKDRGFHGPAVGGGGNGRTYLRDGVWENHLGGKLKGADSARSFNEGGVR